MKQRDEPTAENPMVRTIISELQLEAEKVIDRIEVRRIRMLGGHTPGAHIHNGPVVGTIVEGSVTYCIAGEAPVLLRAGDVFFEPEGRRIEQFDAGPDGVTFLAWFPVGNGDDPDLKLL